MLRPEGQCTLEDLEGSAASTTCRWRSSSPPHESACSRPRRSSNGSPSDSTCSRPAATPTPASEDGPLTARALTCLGAIDSVRGDSAAALNRLEQAIELWRLLGDEARLVEACDELGWAYCTSRRDAAGARAVPAEPRARSQPRAPGTRRQLACRRLPSARGNRAVRARGTAGTGAPVDRREDCTLPAITSSPTVPCTGGITPSPSSTA